MRIFLLWGELGKTHLYSDKKKNSEERTAHYCYMNKETTDICDHSVYNHTCDGVGLTQPEYDLFLFVQIMSIFSRCLHICHLV